VVNIAATRDVRLYVRAGALSPEYIPSPAPTCP
jgi:hypothetical protein